MLKQFEADTIKVVVEKSPTELDRKETPRLVRRFHMVFEFVCPVNCVYRVYCLSICDVVTLYKWLLSFGLSSQLLTTNTTLNKQC